uniref:BLUF domain-containing protein n=1 Tax=Anolis carolinensis TaxID=28377 RepID=A0A803TF91_ANOCA
MSSFNLGTSVLRYYDKKFTKVWERQETSSSSSSSEERVTFLDQLLQKRIHEDKEKFMLHRLVLLAKISPDLADKKDLAEYWEQLFVKLQHSYFQSEGITGLLLLYPTCIVHILESSSDVLYNILRDLRNMEQQQRVLILDAKILIMSHNLPSRLFQQWHYKVLNVPERRLDYDTSQEESAETLTHECLTALLKIGKHLLKYPKSPKNLPDTILEKVPDLIIPQDTICYLLTCQELLSPAQYLQFFDSPLNIQMDSGIGQIVERTVRDGEKVRC